MTQFIWPWLFIGLGVGILLTLLFDFFFWRRRRVCSEIEKELTVQVNNLTAEKGDLNTRLLAFGDMTPDRALALEGDLATANGRIASLEADLNARDAELSDLLLRAGQLANHESNFEGTGWTLGGFLGGLTASSLWNRWRSNDGDIDFDADINRIGDLEADLNARDARIRDMEFNVGRLGDLEADINARDARIAGLEADLRARDLEIEGLNAKVGEFSEFEEALGRRGMTLGGFLGGFGASTLWNRWFGGDADGEVEIDLDAELGRLDAMEVDLADRDVQISGLQADLRAGDLEIEGLNAKLGAANLEVEAANQRVFELETQLGRMAGDLSLGNTDIDLEADELDAFKAQLSSRGMTLGGFLGGFGASSLWNRWSSDDVEGEVEFDLDAELGRLDAMEADLDLKNARLLELEAELSEKNDYLQRLDADADAMVDLQADMLAKNARIAELEAELAGLQLDADQLADVKAKLGARGLTLGGFLGGFTTSSLFGRWFAGDDGDVDIDLDAEFGRIDELEADLDAKDQRIFELETQLGRLSNADFELNGQVADLQAEIENRGAIEANLGVDLDSKDQRIFELETQLGRMAGDIDAANALIPNIDVDAELDGKDRRIFELETQLGRLAGDLDASNALIPSVDIDAELDGKDRRIFELETQLGRLAGSGAEMTNRLGDLELEMGEKDDYLARLEADADAMVDLQAKIQSLESDLAKIQMLEAELADKTYQLEQLNLNLGEQVSIDADAGLMASGFAADLDGKDRRIFDLETQLSRMSSETQFDLGDRDTRILGLEAEIERLNLALASQKVPDDLTKIWGIGPKIAGLLNDKGITTFEQLASTDVETIQGYMEGAGSRYRLSDPKVLGTWAEQANIAATGDNAELKTYQATLKRSDVANPLRKVWGVGAKTESILNQSGINNFEDLLGATESDLATAIESTKGYYPGMDREGIYRSWMEQARLGVDSKWAQLRGFQQQYRTERRRDDLTEIWGIGPALEQIFIRRGINSFDELNALSETQAKEVVSEAGLTKAQLPDDYYNVWLTQSNLLANGDTEGRSRFMIDNRRDDLKLIWGIGPKIESVLNDNGIYTFDALSQTDPDRIDEMLEAAGSRFNLSTENLHETWISQARLADNDDWPAFQALYDSLSWDNVQDEE